MKTEFDGLGATGSLIVEDEPMAGLYDGSRARKVSDNAVRLR